MQKANDEVLFGDLVDTGAPYTAHRLLFYITDRKVPVSSVVAHKDLN